jgi:hypothetical protein
LGLPSYWALAGSGDGRLQSQPSQPSPADQDDQRYQNDRADKDDGLRLGHEPIVGNGPSFLLRRPGEGIAHCVSCGKPMRSVHSPCGMKHLYYRCASWLRDEPCTASRQQVREDLISDQLEPYMAALHLPEDFRRRVEELMASHTETASLEKRRNDLRSQLRRLNYQFEQGLIEEADV